MIDNSPLYRAGDVCGFTGITSAMLRLWRTKNGLFSEKNDGDGWTEYTFADVCLVALVARLNRAGLSVRTAVEIANLARPGITRQVDAMRGPMRAAHGPFGVAIAPPEDQPEAPWRLREADQITLPGEMTRGYALDHTVILIDYDELIRITTTKIANHDPMLLPIPPDAAARAAVADYLSRISATRDEGDAQ